jgi:hypothetical protein
MDAGANLPGWLGTPSGIYAGEDSQPPVEGIEKLNRIYGHDAVNARLGYLKSEIGGIVRNVNLEI